MEVRCKVCATVERGCDVRVFSGERVGAGWRSAVVLMNTVGALLFVRDFSLTGPKF